MSKVSSYPPGTILVGGWNSRCNNCGRETLVHDGNPFITDENNVVVDFVPDDQRAPMTHHRDISGYSAQPGEGCGIEFTHIASTYVGMDEHVAAMRPDLELIPLVHIPKEGV